MARLQFCDYHNMVAILEKSEHNVDFHPIVDFVEVSPLRYALTVKPTVYVSHIRQFWSTARIETTEKGTKILATVDGILRTITESSLRRNLKLQYEDGISSLPDTELFENLTLVGYNISPNQKFTFQKGQFSHHWKYLIYTIMQCMSPKSTWFNKFSCNIATALVCLATNMTYNFSKMIFDGLVKNVNNKGDGSSTPTKLHHTPSPEAHLTLHTTYSSPTLPPVTTASIPIITLSETTPIRQYTRRARITQSSVLLPIVDDPASPLRDVNQERSGDDAPIKERNLDEGEGAAERVSDDTKEMATVLTSMDAATVLASRVADVPTGSGSVPTASPPAAEVPTGSDVVPTASLIFATATVVTPYIRRKGKETLVESETPKKKKIQEQMDIQMARQLKEEMERDAQRVSEQIARDVEITRIHAEEELQRMIDGLDRSNDAVAKYLQEYQQFALELPLERRIELISDLVRYQDNYAKVHKYQSQQRKPWSKKQKKDYYMEVIKSNLDFIPMGSKEKAKRLKRKGLSLEQESVKKLKTSKEVAEEAKSPNEVPEEKVKEMMQLVPIEEVCVEALQVKHPIIDWKLWALVKESLSNRLHTSDKEMELWVELKGLYEPDDANQLWTHTQNLMHALVEWKLYDMCEVHQVNSKNKEIFMLMEKDYPLR
nr:hypothetical protein [Tanacetum cinerariifolium]